jgi:hypothetical protein
MENLTRTYPYKLPVQHAVPIGVIGTVQGAYKAPVYCTDTTGSPESVSRTDPKAVPIASQSELPFMDGPSFPSLPKRRRKPPQKRKGWRVTEEAMEILKTIKTRERARIEAEGNHA